MKKKIGFVLLLLIIFAGVFYFFNQIPSSVAQGSSIATPPVIFFSDLISGPNTGGENNKGAFVTIWGKNFGATQSASYVTVGGGQVDNYPAWTDEKISFQLGKDAATGDIAIITASGTSNAVAFTVRAGNIYFVSTSGNNINNGNFVSPWRTWQYAVSQINPGDIVYGRGGNYTAIIDLGTFGRGMAIGAYANNSGGSIGNPKAFVAYPSETPIIYPTGVSGSIISIYDGEYITLSQLHLYNPDGITIPGSIGTRFYADGRTDNVGNLRIIGNVIKKNFLGPTNALNGALTCSNGHDIYIAGNEVSDIGQDKQEHGIYLNQSLVDVIVEYNVIYDVHNGYGIEVYNDAKSPYTNCVIRNNLVYRCGRAGIQIGSNGNFKVYNNIIRDCGQAALGGLNLRYSTLPLTTYEIYNNVFYDNGENEIDDAWDDPLNEPYGQIYKDNFAIQSGVFRNNIIFSTNTSEPYWVIESNTDSWAFSNNLYYGNGANPLFDNGADTLNIDPLFTDLINYDFHLKSNSPAIDKGFNVSAIVIKDKDGVARPQGSAIDIGAYEY